MFTEEEKEIVREMIDAIEDRDTFIHGDYNMGNVLYQNDKPILIDKERTKNERIY